MNLPLINNTISYLVCELFFFSSRRRHTRWPRDWSSDVCSSDLAVDRAGTQLQAVDRVSYGLEEAALTAARQWLFRPARDGGQAVPAHYDLTFSFGV